MIGALERAFKAIYADIPIPILEAAFTPMKYDVSLDERIKQEVILKRVKGDVDVGGGKVKTIILNPNWLKGTRIPSAFTTVPGDSAVYHIPPEVRDYRDISAYISVGYPSWAAPNTGPGYMDGHLGSRNLDGVAKEIIRSHTYSHTPILPTVTVKEGNILLLSPPRFTAIPWQVRVRLRYDDEFTNMDVSSIDPFAQCVLHATKAYIYTKLIMEIESNTVYHGMEIGMMRDIVSGYSDANERYTEARLQLDAGEICDPDRAVAILANMVGRI